MDALGRPKGGELSSEQATAGNDLRLSIDANVQAAGEEAVSSFGLPGAFVAMDIHSGEVVGLGSRPTFDPSLFTRPSVPPSEIERLDSEAAEYPSRTGRSRACIRRARRSSRSPQRQRSRGD